MFRRHEGRRSPDFELVAVDVARVVQKWINQITVETRILEPGERFPDIEELFRRKGRLLPFGGRNAQIEIGEGKQARRIF